MGVGGLSRAPRSFCLGFLLVFCAALAGAAPAAWDWRNVGGLNYVSPVKNQGSCGSCWALCAVEAVESRIMIQSLDPTIQPDLSEQELVSCATAAAGYAPNNGCGGGNSGRALKYIMERGVVKESAFPYASGGGTAPACPGTLAGPKIYIQGWSTVAANAAAVKEAIATTGPVTASVEVYDSWHDYSSGVMTSVAGTYSGRKAVLLVGYDDAGGCWIAKSTWGTFWGEAGYVRIGYALDGTVLLFDAVYSPGAVDWDGDGYFADDCDDTDPEVHPGAVEVADGVDNDCDGTVDGGTGDPDDPGDDTGGGGGSDSCLFASVARGSGRTAELALLRRYRDEVLERSALGRGLAGLYYRCSAPLARAVRRHPALVPPARLALRPAVLWARLALKARADGPAAAPGLTGGSSCLPCGLSFSEANRLLASRDP